MPWTWEIISPLVYGHQKAYELPLISLFNFHEMSYLSKLKDLSQKKTQNTYKVVLLETKLNYNDSNENNIKCPSKVPLNFLLMLIEITNKQAKNII